ncbi:unnamed protein product [Auanema sp. JU1783]|nr:unnamed protein product [Auanema sp. JU1783]
MGYITMTTALLTVFICFCSIAQCSIDAEEEPIRQEIDKINPIVRYRVTNTLRKKLPQLEVLAQRRNEYRNCYFSPIQCQLPVRREGLLAAILRESNDPVTDPTRPKRLFLF